MKRFDLPPVWLIGAVALSWGLSKLTPELVFGTWSSLGGAFLFAAGIVLTGLAVNEFNKSRTTIIPGLTPEALVTSGIFRFSRNPIYLADVLFLTAFILWWDAILALPLIPVFIWIIRTRFINWEETRLAETFGTSFEEFKSRTGRWI